MKHLILAALISGTALAQPMRPATTPVASAEPEFVAVAPMPPASLSAEQTAVWNNLRNMRSTKDIKLIAIDPATLAGDSISLNIDGKSYLFKGSARPLPGVQQFLITPGKGVKQIENTPDYIRWEGEYTQDGKPVGGLGISYDPQTGAVQGGATVNGRRLSLSGRFDAAFLREVSPDAGFTEPESMTKHDAASAPGAQK